MRFDVERPTERGPCGRNLVEGYNSFDLNHGGARQRRHLIAGASGERIREIPGIDIVDGRKFTKVGHQDGGLDHRRRRLNRLVRIEAIVYRHD